MDHKGLKNIKRRKGSRNVQIYENNLYLINFMKQEKGRHRLGLFSLNKENMDTLKYLYPFVFAYLNLESN